ncbi:hypothetical protein BS47DRAFT_1367928 [Hydnum rufescens UP504]|uniref:Uncharacterized protein n=1 Tax=Hydnum rufescens UP504 TaxID=1448309 RepID=A0A9P6AH25_9AGAM|nr:hypothetical protein BS47DRAFT_1367928 [Hydnum rufescens UP504]
MNHTAVTARLCGSTTTNLCLRATHQTNPRPLESDNATDQTGTANSTCQGPPPDATRRREHTTSRKARRRHTPCGRGSCMILRLSIMYKCDRATRSSINAPPFVASVPPTQWLFAISGFTLDHTTPQPPHQTHDPANKHAENGNPGAPNETTNGKLKNQVARDHRARTNPTPLKRVCDVLNQTSHQTQNCISRQPKTRDPG